MLQYLLTDNKVLAFTVFAVSPCTLCSIMLNSLRSIMLQCSCRTYSHASEPNLFLRRPRSAQARKPNTQPQTRNNPNRRRQPEHRRKSGPTCQPVYSGNWSFGCFVGGHRGNEKVQTPIQTQGQLSHSPEPLPTVRSKCRRNGVREKKSSSEGI